MKICSSSHIRELDRLADEKYGIRDYLLMENAGNAVYYLIKKEIGLERKRFLVIAGTGNNGGDALVVARKLHSMGTYVHVTIVGNPDKYREPAKTNYEILRKIGLTIHVITSLEGVEKFKALLKNSDVVVEGLFGIGLSREITGIYREVIDAVNNSSKIVVSVDIPSGIGGNDGRVYGTAIKADYTVTFGLPKVGNILYPGYYYCGKLYVSYISYPQELIKGTETGIELNYPIPPPERPKWGHKGTFGKLLVISGARNYFGAPYFSSLSFLKAGGGYSRLAAPASLIPVLGGKASEVVYIPMEETEEGSLSLKNEEKILSVIEDYGIDFVILGPGTSLNEETQELIRRLTRLIDRPIILDGDGITALSSNLSILKERPHPTILTPHPVEMSRLIGKSVKEILSSPIDILKEASVELGVYIVLKIAHSLIAYPTGKIFVNMTGNPGMATAGSGDVLTGTIAAMMGIGYDIGEAVRMGVLVHGLAGDLASEAKGEDGITAQDILEHLPFAVRMLRENTVLITKKCFPEPL